MHGDDVGAGLGEGLDVGVDRRDHQVHVEHLIRVGTQRRDHVGPQGDVGHEMAVHDIDVDVVGAGRGDRADLLAHAGEIGGQNGRGDANVLLHGARIPLNSRWQRRWGRWFGSALGISKIPAPQARAFFGRNGSVRPKGSGAK
jgi:hypothetical protein